MPVRIGTGLSTEPDARAAVLALSPEIEQGSRRGFLDGVGIRLPTICVRPGLPNRAGFQNEAQRLLIASLIFVASVAKSTPAWKAR